MGVLPPDIFIKTKNEYQTLINPSSSPEEKRDSAYTIVDKIISYIFNLNNKKDLKVSVDKERQRKIEKKEVKVVGHHDKPYRSKYDILDFLCDQEYIPKRFEPSLKFLLQRGHKKTLPEELELKSKASEHSTHEIINQFLSWFLETYRQPKDYLVPVHFSDDPEQTKDYINPQAITTILNIRKSERRWFKKYQTIFAFLFILSPLIIYLWSRIDWMLYSKYNINTPSLDLSFLEKYNIISGRGLLLVLWIVFLIVSLIGLYNTYYYTTRKMVRYVRYFLFSLAPLVSLILISISLVLDKDTINPELVQKAYFDTDPSFKGDGFIYISRFSGDQTLDSLAYADEVDLKDLPQDDFGGVHLYLEAHIRNIGEQVMDSAYISIYRDFIEKDLRLQVSVSEPDKFYDPVLSDVITIKNIDTTAYNMLFTNDGKTIYKCTNKDSQGNIGVRDSIIETPRSVSKVLNGYYGRMYQIPSSLNSNVDRIIHCFVLRIHPKITITKVEPLFD